MALANYSDLKTSVQDWMARSDLSGNVADWITLAEARLNRELNPVEVDQTLTGTVDARTIDVSAYAIVEPIALYLVDPDNSDEIELTKATGFAFENTSDEPKLWEYDPDASAGVIRFDCPLDQAYTFRFRYRQRFALSDSNTTNWLLTNHPDVYLAASLMWGGGFVANFQNAAAFKAILDEGIPSVRNIIAQSKRARAMVDPALNVRNQRPYYDGTID